MVLSVPGALSLGHSAKEIVKWAEVLVLYLFVASETDLRWRKILILAILITGAIAALHGIYQFLFQVGPEAFLLFERFMRAHGTFEQPNPFAGYLGLTLPIAVALAIGSLLRVAGQVPRKWLILAASTGGLMMTALFMSWSRGAWLGFAAALAVMGVAVVVRSGRAAVITLLLLGLVAYVILSGGLAQIPASLTQRFSDFVPYLDATDVRGLEITDANYAVLERLAHWQTALAMWTDHPLLGVGIGNYSAAYAEYALPLWPVALGHAHNYYLNIAAEAGFLGLLSYLLLVVAALATAWHRVRKATGWQWAVALGVLGVLVHLSVHSLFDSLYVHAIYLNIAILLGVTAPYGRG
jgi:O-antigen ligase